MILVHYKNKSLPLLRIILVLVILAGIEFVATAEEFGYTSGAQADAFADLEPENPNTFFLIGETLLARASDSSDQKIAREVLALGVSLAAHDNQPQLAASMCIALAESESDSNQVAELWDLALFLDSSRGSAWRKFRDLRYRQEYQLRMDAVQCLRAARFSQPEIASKYIDQPQIKNLLIKTAQQANLDPKRVLRSIAELIDQAENDSCKGRGFITHRENGVVTRELCPDHLRPIGTANSDQSLSDLLHLESLLFAPLPGPLSDTDWGGVAYLQVGLPVSDPSISALLEHYSVDPSRPYRKGNRWVSKP